MEKFLQRLYNIQLTMQNPNAEYTKVRASPIEIVQNCHCIALSTFRGYHVQPINQKRHVVATLYII